MGSPNDGPESPEPEREITPRGLLAALIPVALALAVVAALLVWKVVFAHKTQAPPGDAPVVNVETRAVRAIAEYVDGIVLPATVEANRVVEVSAEVAGRIEKLHREKGTGVRERDVIVELNTDLLQAEFDRAEAQAKHDKARYDRAARLRGQGAATDEDLDAAVAALAVSRASLASARASLDRARITSPISGILDGLDVEKGEYVMPGTAVARVVDIETAKVVVAVPEKEIGFLKTGDRADVIFSPNGEDRTVRGSITYIGELADGATHSTRVEITVDNSGHALRSGQIVRAGLTRRILNGVIMVPLSAVIPMEDGKAVYVVDGGTPDRMEVAGETMDVLAGAVARRCEVKLGLIKERSVQITSGLKTGDLLIVAGHRFVAPGQKVTVTRNR